MRAALLAELTTYSSAGFAVSRVRLAQLTLLVCSEQRDQILYAGGAAGGAHSLAGSLTVSRVRRSSLATDIC
jgi:hypothetical protein